VVDLPHVVAERLLEHALVTQVVPEAVHVGVPPQRQRHAADEALPQLVRGGGGGEHLVVPRDDGGLVLPDAVRDQVDLVTEVVVQHAVRELGVLGDLPQAGSRVAQLGERS